MTVFPAPDINDVAWDTQRDSPTERRSLLQELDPLPEGMAWARFVPEVRTRRAGPLGERARLLLLGCSTEDLETIANEINLVAELDDDAEAEGLRRAIEAYEALLGAHRVLASDRDEKTIARMPLAERRRARELQNEIMTREATRYDGARLGRGRR